MDNDFSHPHDGPAQGNAVQDKTAQGGDAQSDARGSDAQSDFSQDLAAWLNATQDRYVVDRTLKQTPSETTQLVYRRGADGHAVGSPFVRKVFSDETCGRAYKQLFGAQTTGVRLEHQPIIYDCESTDSTFEVVMEYVRGRTLEAFAQEEGAGAHLAALVFPQLCDALCELHESFPQPLIHRDVKPSNIMVSRGSNTGPAGKVTLIDLGIARTYRDEATRDTMRYGTPGYAPPEQFGYGQTTVRSDVYAAGMTLAFCLTGEDPSPQLRENAFADARIPPAFRDVLQRATQFDPALRFANAHELKAAFDAAYASWTSGPTLPGFSRRDAPEGFSQREAQRGASQGEAERSDVAQGQRKARRGFSVPAGVGATWNGFVIAVWALLLAALANGIPNPVERLKDTPVSLRVIMYVGVFVVPFTAVGYLLLDKRRLRKHEPFSRLTWKRELLLCALIIVFSVMLTLILYAVLRPSGNA